MSVYETVIKFNPFFLSLTNLKFQYLLQATVLVAFSNFLKATFCLNKVVVSVYVGNFSNMNLVNSIEVDSKHWIIGFNRVVGQNLKEEFLGVPDMSNMPCFVL